MPKGTAGEIVITRVFDAPRALVFEAWSRPKHLMRWFAPDDCTVPYCSADFRVGGKFHFCMRFAGGRDIWGIGVYREIVPPERIVYIDSFADAQGNPVPPAHYGMSAQHPAESRVSVTFAEADGRTTVTLRHAMAPDVPERSGMEEGWNQMFNRLAAFAASG